MNIKNILIALGVLGIGLILYKLLFGFVLPIALFVSLGYVLKFLLKGSESESGEDFSQILTKNEPSSSKENIVEIRPIEKDKNAEGIRENEEDNNPEGTKENEEDKNAEGMKENEEGKNPEGMKENEEDKTAE